MGQLHNEAMKSVAIEAIVSRDGKIKRRIPNFETVLDKVSEDDFRVFPALAANDADDIIPVLLDSVTADDVDEKPVALSHKRYGTYIFGIAIVITFAWSVNSLFLGNNGSVTAIDESSSPLTTTVTVNDSEQLKRIADLILSDNSWTKERTSRFLHHWNKLDEAEAHEVTTSPWYQLFTFNLKQRIKQHSPLVSGSTSKIAQDPLLTLAAVTGLINENGELLADQQNQSKYRQLIDELTKEIAQVDKAANHSGRSSESEASLNARLREEFAIPSTSIKEESPVIDVPTPATINTAPISAADITQLIKRYKMAYESGDMETISRLFGAVSSDNSVSKQLAASFNTIFGNSASRKINFYDIESKISGKNATITSKFNATIEFKNNKGTQYVVADAKMNIQKSDGQLVISSLNILNRKTSVVSPAKPNASERTRLVKPVVGQNLPTPAELQDVTTQLITSYETGDINMFLSLFSEDIKTNDRIDLAGVKQDYMELFQNTSDRQMFIQNLKWSTESIGSKGVGDLEVVILSDEGGTVYSMEGKIQIVAQKVDDKVKITHLYHIEREK